MSESFLEARSLSVTAWYSAYWCTHARTNHADTAFNCSLDLVSQTCNKQYTPVIRKCDARTWCSLSVHLAFGPPHWLSYYQSPKGLIASFLAASPSQHVATHSFCLSPWPYLFWAYWSSSSLLLAQHSASPAVLDGQRHPVCLEFPIKTQLGCERG